MKPLVSSTLQPEITALRIALIERGNGDVVTLPSHINHYLRIVTQAPLMSRGRELEVGREIETGQREVVSALLQTPLAARLGIYPDTPRSSAQVAKAVETLRAAYKSVVQATADGELACTDQDYGIPTAALGAIVAKVRQGDQRATTARAELVESHLRSVVVAAQQFSDADFAKAVQRGNIALLTAACSFDYLCGERFSAFAMRSVRELWSQVATKQPQKVRRARRAIPDTRPTQETVS